MLYLLAFFRNRRCRTFNHHIISDLKLICRQVENAQMNELELISWLLEMIHWDFLTSLHHLLSFFKDDDNYDGSRLVNDLKESGYNNDITDDLNISHCSILRLYSNMIMRLFLVTEFIMLLNWIFKRAAIHGPDYIISDTRFTTKIRVPE